MTPAQIEERANRCRQMGSKGGQATVDKYGRGWMKAIGAAGFKTYCERYHDGNDKAALEALKLAKPRSLSKRAGR